MPPDLISRFLLSHGIDPWVFLGSLILAGAVTSAVAVRLLDDGPPS